MNGQEITYYPNQQVKSEIMWINGEKIGPFVEYYDNGLIACKGEFQDNDKVAECFVYYPTGETNKEQIKINDVPDGPFTVILRMAILIYKVTIKKVYLKENTSCIQ